MFLTGAVRFKRTEKTQNMLSRPLDNQIRRKPENGHENLPSNQLQVENSTQAEVP